MYHWCLEINNECLYLKLRAKIAVEYKSCLFKGITVPPEFIALCRNCIAHVYRVNYCVAMLLFRLWVETVNALRPTNQSTLQLTPSTPFQTLEDTWKAVEENSITIIVTSWIETALDTPEHLTITVEYSKRILNELLMSIARQGGLVSGSQSIDCLHPQSE